MKITTVLATFVSALTVFALAAVPA